MSSQQVTDSRVEFFTATGQSSICLPACVERCFQEVCLIWLQKNKETQPSLTNRAARLEVSQGTKRGNIPYVRYDFLLVCYGNFVPKTDNSTSKNVVILKSLKM